MSETEKVVEAEKGRNLSPQNLHIRLRVVEAVVLASLLLNLVAGFIALHANNEIRERVEEQKRPPNAP